MQILPNATPMEKLMSTTKASGNQSRTTKSLGYFMKYCCMRNPEKAGSS